MRGRTRRRRIALTTAVLAACVLVTTGCGGSGGSEPKAVKTPEYAEPDDLPERISVDGTTIVVGWPKATTSLHLYEDLRCPACGQFENEGNGTEVTTLAQAGKAQARYTLASFLDDRHGDGSKRAANALRAAVERGKFTEYREVLFAAQSEEPENAFTAPRLLELASQVKGLRGKEFDAAVRTMKYRDFVRRSQQAFEKSSVRSTPSLVVDGKRIDGELADVAMYEPGGLTYLVDNSSVLIGQDGGPGVQ
ncbi:thioredoxin domain-containing protein [Streptomyces sp. NA04227]|uniref:DsbA family protein n=1 Tax=Streptomyces sp. NA04227 TaxID=2742136 RepID=UPI00158FADCB|nr:thioredoxin domain-containing protein [Streptomyces sp. NA04227]QKW05827.1 thioredoxin domain-containing protein [Streptomyces sp. NA04227]